MANTDLKGMAKKLRRFGNQLPNKVNEIKKVGAYTFLKEVVPATPKLTGQARENWVTSLGAPDRATTLPGPGTGSRAIERGRVSIQGAQPKQSIYVQNNLPYIGLLNEGYSAKAPAGFVQIAVVQARKAVSRERLKWEG